MLARRATYTPHDTAYCFPERQQAYTWARLWQEVQQLATGLLHLGIQKGDRVAVMLEGRAELVVSLLGVATVGAVVVPINTYSTKQEVETYFRDARPAAFLTGTAARQFSYTSLASELQTPNTGSAGAWLPRHVFVQGSEAEVAAPFRCYSELLAPASSVSTELFVQACQAVRASDPAFLLYTSGTTGTPKGVLRSVASFLGATPRRQGLGQHVQAAAMRLGDRYTKRFAVMTLLPLYHLGGIGTLFTSLKMCNVRMVMLTHFNPVTARAVTAAEECKFLIGTPFMIQAMFAAQPAAAPPLRLVLGVVFASAAVTGSMLARIAQELPNLHFFTVSYGSSEAGAVANGTCLLHKKRNLATSLFLRLLRSINLLSGLLPYEAFSQTPFSICGRVDKQVAVRSIDLQTGEFLPPGQAGELVIRSHRVMRYAQEALAQESFLADGWYRSGDIGYVDAQGCLVITDRIKRLISRGGEKISPVEIEHTLLQHPGVAEAFVVGVPDALYGEQIGAVLVAKPATELDLAELRAWLGGRLSQFKVPHYIVLAPALPLSATGKVSSEVLKQLVQQTISQPVLYA
jgi:fatty-acyl-CoA synthase